VNGVAGATGFYAIFPHGLMVALFAPVFAFALLALGVGITRFWRDAAPGAAGGPALAEAAHDALSLKYLDGGHGQGCNEESDRFTRERRAVHHATFYGFMLCFASTSVATVYHYAFGWVAPYGWLSLPKLLGGAGGVLLVLGCAGLLRLRLARNAHHQLAEQRPMDLAFITLLGLTGASGLLLALARGSGAMPALLCLHLGAVMALFVTLPYGKFAHAGYRIAALLKWSIEKRQPSRLKLGSE
jgi:citrate/tricarballylate utilization protein